MKKLFLMLMTFLMMSVCINAQEVTTSKIDSLENRISNLEEEVKYLKVKDTLNGMSISSNTICISILQIDEWINDKFFNKEAYDTIKNHYNSFEYNFKASKTLVKVYEFSINDDYLLQLCNSVCVVYERALYSYKLAIDRYEKLGGFKK